MSTEPVFDLRSDTVTRPGRAMREAMATAAVGDDVYGEDPTVIALERRVAELLGKESALFVPSGTMSNQIALLVHTRPGDEVVIGEGAHVAFYESGAGAALAGVQFAQAGAGGLFDADELSAAVKPKADYHPRTSLVCLENTHNRAGGRVFPQPAVEAVVEARARARPLRAPRRREVVARRVGHGQLGSRARAAVRYRQRLLFEGLGRTRGLRAGGHARAFESSATLSQDARRGHAPGRNFGCRRAVRARASTTALEPRSRRGESARARCSSHCPACAWCRRRRTSCPFRSTGLGAERVVAEARARGVLLNATGRARCAR